MESERIISEKRSLEQRIYISSLPGSDAEGLGAIVRGHWSIEIRLHWVLDVSLREDHSRIRKGSAPEAAAMLRHIVLYLLRMDLSPGGASNHATFTLSASPLTAYYPSWSSKGVAIAPAHGAGSATFRISPWGQSAPAGSHLFISFIPPSSGTVLS